MMETYLTLLDRGGPVLAMIGGLSVITLALILWKVWHLTLLGTWGRGVAGQGVLMWRNGEGDNAVRHLARRRPIRSRIVWTAMSLERDPDLDEVAAREETARHAQRALREVRSGLRALDLIVTIAPLLGLFGTVLGMIEAFQALQSSGGQTDASALAGGIWEALLTTAAGMGVAIPAALALGWFDSIADRLQSDLEDLVTQVFVYGGGGGDV